MSTSDVETRVNADSDQLSAGQAAANSMALFMDQLIEQAKKSPGLRERTESLVDSFMKGDTTMKAEMVFDSDGVVSFQFYALRGGYPPKLIFDCVPTRKLDS